MGAMAFQITSLTIVYSTVYSGANQSEHQSSASMAFVWGIHQGPMNSPHKWPVTRKMFPFHDVIMISSKSQSLESRTWSYQQYGCDFDTAGSSNFDPEVCLAPTSRRWVCEALPYVRIFPEVTIKARPGFHSHGDMRESAIFRAPERTLHATSAAPHQHKNGAAFMLAQWSFHYHCLPSIPAWIRDYIHHKVWNEVIYPFPNFNGCTVEVWEWISHFIPHFIGHVITYPCTD